jgi:DNA polymerase III subunit alpha
MPLYQEQISEMAKVIAGFNDTEADEYRAAIGKKNKEKFDAAQAKFKKGGMALGHPEDFMDFLVAALTGFARYGWNRGHAAGYSYIAYVTAYLETHFPIEYYTALLNTNLDKNDQLTILLSAIMQKGIEIKPPDINVSGALFSTDGTAIYMGLLSVRQLAAEALIGTLWERELNGPYRGFFDYVRRVCNLTPIKSDHRLFVLHKLPNWDYGKHPDVPAQYGLKSVTKTVIENLVKAGSFTFDDTITNKDKIAVIETAQKLAKKDKNVDDFKIIGKAADIISNEEFTKLETSALEREALNFYVSGHPVTAYVKYSHLLHSDGQLVTPSQIKGMEPECGVVVMGLLAKKESKQTKTGKTYLVLRLQDQFGEINVRVWSPLATDIWPHLQENAIILVKGVTKPDNFREGEIDVYVRMAITAPRGLPVRGYIVDDPEKISYVSKTMAVEPAGIASVPGYGTVVHLSQTYSLQPDLLDKFLGVEGLKLALSL